MREPLASAPRAKRASQRVSCSSRATAGRGALESAYRLLSYRGRSKKELKERLRLKGFPESEVERAIAALSTQGFLDDRKLASALTRYARETKCLGLSGTKRFLRERGLSRDIIEEAVQDTDETEAAMKIAEKRLKSLRAAPRDKQARSLAGTLYRRGFSPETIKKTLDHVTLKEDS